MIRTFAALAALAAAVPAIAAAQTPPADSVTVYGQRPDSYSVRIPTAGKDAAEVRREIFDTSYFVCQMAPMTGNRADYTVDAMQTCVSKAQQDAVQQYDRMIDR